MLLHTVKMPKVSENPISRETERQIFDAFIKTFARIDNPQVLKMFADDLFTPTEKIMLAKRLMAAVLIQKGYAPSVICSILKMSKTTVNTIQRDLRKHGEGYKTVFNKFFRETRVEKFLDSAEKWLRALQLPIKGSRSDMRRWQKAVSSLSRI